MKCEDLLISREQHIKMSFPHYFIVIMGEWTKYLPYLRGQQTPKSDRYHVRIMAYDVIIGQYDVTQ